MSEYPENLEDLLKSFYQPAKAIVESGAQHQPLLFGHSPLSDTGWIGIALDFSDDAAKHESVARARAVFAAYGVDGYLFISEAWAIKIHQNDPEAARYLSGEIRASKSDRRVEILSIIAVNHERQLLGQADIGMTADGKRTLADLEIIPTENSNDREGGRMQSLLPPRDFTPILDEELREEFCRAIGYEKMDIDKPTVN